ncbi:MAG: flagellar protein FlgN [Treponema sp.]|jgi:hypothetical protein|nr:flagellar protein FlgN [Treponema sp.]
MASLELSQKELDERIAILTRWRSLLQQQRDKFSEYLKVLEKQQISIEEENPEKIMAYTEIEQQVLSSITNLRKVILPLEKMYTTKNAKVNDEKIPKLQIELDNLQKKVIVQNEKNRELLKAHMNQIRSQLQSIKNPYRNARSVYASQNAPTSSIVDIMV